MDNETLRTLITAVSAVLTTGTVACFGWLTLVRKERLEKLRRELIYTLRQYEGLYAVEDHLLDKLERGGVGKKQILKIDARKDIAGATGGKIVLTAEAARKRASKLERGE